MDIVSYVYKHIRDAGTNVLVYILGPLWGWLHDSYLSGELIASPYLWITLFWASNWVMGTALALASGPPPPGQPDERFEPRKSVRSIMKLIVWLMALMIATGLRRSGVTGGWIPAGTLELAAVVTECTYAMRNLGRIAKRFGNDQQGRILSMVADSADEILRARTVTSVSVDTPIEGQPAVVTVDERTITTTLKVPKNCLIREDGSCPLVNAAGKCPDNCAEKPKKVPSIKIVRKLPDKK